MTITTENSIESIDLLEKTLKQIRESIFGVQVDLVSIKERNIDEKLLKEKYPKLAPKTRTKKPMQQNIPSTLHVKYLDSHLEVITQCRDASKCFGKAEKKKQKTTQPQEIN